MPDLCLKFHNGIGIVLSWIMFCVLSPYLPIKTDTKYTILDQTWLSHFAEESVHSEPV